MTKDVQSINQLTDEQLFEMYKNHPDEGTRMTACLEMARRVGMVRAYIMTPRRGNRRDLRAMEVGIAATFQTCRLSGQQRG